MVIGHALQTYCLSSNVTAHTVPLRTTSCWFNRPFSRDKTSLDCHLGGNSSDHSYLIRAGGWHDCVHHRRGPLERICVSRWAKSEIGATDVSRSRAAVENAECEFFGRGLRRGLCGAPVSWNGGGFRQRLTNANSLTHEVLTRRSTNPQQMVTHSTSFAGSFTAKPSPITSRTDESGFSRRISVGARWLLEMEMLF